MKTKFNFYDENNDLKNADLILAFELDNRKYILYELEEEKNNSEDVMHVGYYTEENNQPIISDVEPENMQKVKDKVDELLNEIDGNVELTDNKIESSENKNTNEEYTDNFKLIREIEELLDQTDELLKSYEGQE